MTAEGRASEEKPTRTLDLVVRDLRGLLTPLTRQFDAIDEYTLNQLLSEIAAQDAREKELAEKLIPVIQSLERMEALPLTEIVKEVKKHLEGSPADSEAVK